MLHFLKIKIYLDGTGKTNQFKCKIQFKADGKLQMPGKKSLVSDFPNEYEKPYEEVHNIHFILLQIQLLVLTCYLNRVDLTTVRYLICKPRILQRVKGFKIFAPNVDVIHKILL